MILLSLPVPLVEIQKVIALIGILVSLSVPNLVKYLDKASNSGMKNQENSITAAANLYIEDHCKNPLYGYICPESYTNPDPGQEKYLCLSDLQDDKNVEEGIKRESYIGPIKYDESMCDGVILFTKSDSKTNSGYNNIKTYLACGYDYSGSYDYTTDDEFVFDRYSDCLKNN